MRHTRLSRRQALALGGAALVTKLLGTTVAETPLPPMRIGVILPTRVQTALQRHASYEGVVEATRNGVVMGEEIFGLQAELLGRSLEVLISTAPTEDAAIRAAQRLAATEEIFAIVGGFGKTQALALSQLAEERGILFINVGSSSDALRGEACSRFTFHIEASAAMYLDAMTSWFSHSGLHNWFFVHEDTEEGQALYRRATVALGKWSEAQQVGRSIIAPELPVFTEAIEAIRQARPEIVLLLLDWLPQLNFLGQHEATGLTPIVMGFPSQVSQTREFFATSRNTAPRAGAGYHTVLWETTLEAHGASELNNLYISRWGRPMDPSAWAAYQAINILFEAAMTTGSLEGAKLVEHLEDPQTTFDVAKGVNVSFRPWDHQLRQPLYLLGVDATAEAGSDLRRRLALINLVEELPVPVMTDGDLVDHLDQIGDLAHETQCRF